MATPRTDDLPVPRGADRTFMFPVRDSNDDPLLDWDGWTARSQARRTVKSEVVLASWTTAPNVSPAGLITLGFETINGVVESVLKLKVAHDQSTPWDWTVAVYDIELISPEGEVTRLAEGKIKVSPDVTR